MLDYLVAGVYIESKIDPSTVPEGAGTRPEESRERRIAREVGASDQRTDRIPYKTNGWPMYLPISRGHGD